MSRNRLRIMDKMDSGKQLKAPAHDGALVAVPPLTTAGAVLDLNRQCLHEASERLVLLGRPLAELRRQAREQVLHAESGSDRPLLVAGHQPELFHPGVWVKNFALYGLARQHQAAALNLVVDDDAIKTTTLRVPAPPYIRRVLFDQWTGAVPYEERAIADRTLFTSFAERVGELTRHWPYEPMLPAFWTEVLRQAEHTANLGQCFAAARRTFEQAWGCHNQEVPLSTLCDSEPFAYFACHLLANLPHFHSLYNEIVADYRRRHGIRNRQHPVPDLAADGDWLETPFWCWRTGASRRERLFARLANGRIELQASGVALAPRVEFSGALTPPVEFSGALTPRVEFSGALAPPVEFSPGANTSPLAVWQELHSRGLKIRTRALTTTLYVRLFLADLFIHGIGGGIYDELTDELMRRFYGIEPPEYLVLSATRWLPLPRPAATPDDRRRLHQLLRDLHYNPQRHLDAGPPWDELVRRKHEWIAQQPTTRAQRRERLRRLRILTEELRRPLQPRIEQLYRQLQECEHQLRTNAILQRRDYSFCLFPESDLRPFCTQFLQTSV